MRACLFVGSLIASPCVCGQGENFLISLFRLLSDNIVDVLFCHMKLPDINVFPMKISFLIRDTLSGYFHLIILNLNLRGILINGIEKSTCVICAETTITLSADINCLGCF